MRLRRLVPLVAGLATLGSFGLSTTALAAAPPALPAGISVTPAIQDRVLSPKDNTVSFSIQLYNHTDRSLTLAITTSNFDALNQVGGIVFKNDPNQPASKGHGLSDVLKIDSPQITLLPNTTKVVMASVANVSALSPGGHYAAILARVVPDKDATGGNKIALNQALSSLVFLETAGQGTKTLKLLQPSTTSPSFKLPTQLNLVFKATGNTQTTPRGVATILHGDTVVEQGILNENSSLVLPGSSRLFDTALRGNPRPIWPGSYTLRVQYRYEGSLGVTTYEKRFYYINIFAFIFIISVTGIIVLLGLRSRELWRRIYNKKRPLILTKRIVKVRDNSHKALKIIVSRRSKK